MLRFAQTFCVAALLVLCYANEHSSVFQRILQAAKDRANRVREASDAGVQTKWSAQDALSMAIDYTSDRIEHPPLQAVEQNLLALQNDLKIVANKLNEIVRRLNEVGIETKEMKPTCTKPLVPVQSKRKTLIKGNN